MGSSRGSATDRARRALEAMKPLGISKKQAAPVLKRLLKLFANNWEPIEEDGYRALADAILDNQVNCSVDVADQEQDTNTIPRVDRHQHQQPSTSFAAPDVLGSDIRTDFTANHRSNSLDPPSPPSTAGEQDPTMVISPQCASPPQTRASAQLRQPALGKRPMQMMNEDFQHFVFLREPKPEPDDLDASGCQNAKLAFIDHPSNTRSSGVLALPPPDQNSKQTSGAKNRTIQRCRNLGMSTLSVEPTSSMVNNDKGFVVKNMQEAPCLDIDVASSAMGEVKMSLKCTLDPSTFRMPALEAVFKMVENKCLRSHKILPPDISIGSLMTEICHCVLQLGTTPVHNMESDSRHNGRRSHNGGNEKQKAVEEEELLFFKGAESGPLNSTPAQQQHYLAISTVRPIHDVIDISKGEERVRISVVNEFGREKCPPSFYYIPRNLVFQNARVSISLAKVGGEDCCSDCFGNCLSAPVPCACARKTGGEYAYTLEGLVRPAFIDECASMNRFPEEHHSLFCKTCPLERSRNKASPEPCRGHSVRKFIKECWSKCGCNMQCGNRVVQRGISSNLQVFFTGEGTDWGLRTLDELPKGAFVCEYVGEILTTTELHERVVQNMQNARHTHPILLDAVWGSERVLKDEEALCLDATFYGNVGRFINHRCCDANLVVIPVEVETPDHHYYHLAFFTSKKLEAFEELTWDYGIDFDDEKEPVKVFQCLCGSRYCRGRRHPRKRTKSFY